MEVIDAENFYSRLERLQNHWLTHKSSVWDGAESICICYGTRSEDLLYSKFSSFHLYAFGYEFPDSILLLTKNDIYFMATTKKCAILESSLKDKSPNFKLHLLQRTKDEGNNRELMNTLLNAARKNGKKIGSLYKSEYLGTFIPSWFDLIEKNQMEKVEITLALSLFFAKKDDAELVSSKPFLNSQLDNYDLNRNFANVLVY